MDHQAITALSYQISGDSEVTLYVAPKKMQPLNCEVTVNGYTEQLPVTFTIIKKINGYNYRHKKQTGLRSMALILNTCL